MLVDPSSAPDHSLASSWTAGSVINGTPGTLEPGNTGFIAWQETKFTPAQLADLSISGPNADPDGDGSVNLLEYALLSEPLSADLPADLLQTGTITVGPDTFLTLIYSERTPNGDLTYIPQLSSDLDMWREGGDHLIETSRDDQGDGSSLVTVRSNIPVNSPQDDFIRLKVVHTAP